MVESAAGLPQVVDVAEVRLRGTEMPCSSAALMDAEGAAASPYWGWSQIAAATTGDCDIPIGLTEEWRT